MAFVTYQFSSTKVPTGDSTQLSLEIAMPLFISPTRLAFTPSSSNEPRLSLLSEEIDYASQMQGSRPGFARSYRVVVVA